MGVDIEIIEPGDGTTFAKKGDTVVVHYKGTLTNGKKFDCSYDRGKPFQTKIGVGRVIKGWDEAFQKMSKNEKAKLVISPDCAYGAQGAPGPANQTLIFEVHLLDIIPA
ncbi:hypothetical protein BsWGS_02981 [Bradybaena similaris]